MLLRQRKCVLISIKRILMEEGNLSRGDKFVIVIMLILYAFNILIHIYFLAMITRVYPNDWIILSYLPFFVYGFAYALLILTFNVTKKVKGVIFENYMFTFSLFFLVALFIDDPLWNILVILQVFGIVISMLSLRLLYKGFKSTGK